MQPINAIADRETATTSSVSAHTPQRPQPLQMQTRGLGTIDLGAMDCNYELGIHLANQYGMTGGSSAESGFPRMVDDKQRESRRHGARWVSQVKHRD